MTPIYRFHGALYREAGPVQQVLDFQRLQCPGGSMDVWLVQTTLGYAVAYAQTGGQLTLDTTPYATEQQARRAFGQLIHNAVNDTGKFYCRFETVDDPMDQRAQKMLQTLQDPTWGPSWDAPQHTAEETELQEFAELLGDQLRSWLGGRDPLRLLQHRAWPRFHQLVVQAVREHLGDPVRLYRGVYGDAASRILDGGTMPMRQLTSWTLDRRYAKDFVLTTPGGAEGGRSKAWVTVTAQWPAESIVFAPVVIPELEPLGIDPKLLRDAFIQEDECVVRSDREELEDFRIVHRTRRKRKTAGLLQEARSRTALTPEQKDKKRSLQFEQRLQRSIEQAQDQQFDFDAEYLALLNQPGNKSFSRDDLTEEQMEEAYAAAVEEVWRHYSKEDVTERVEYSREVSVLESAVNDAEIDLEDAEEEGADAKTLRQLQDKLDRLQAEYEAAVRPGGSVWNEVLENLAYKYVWTIADERFHPRHELRRHLEARAIELLKMKGHDVWRSVVMDAHKDPTAIQNLGIYWVDKKDRARPFVAEMDKTKKFKDPMVVRYHAVIVDPKYIDVTETLISNLWGLMVGPRMNNETDVHEVRFFKHAPVYVESVDIMEMDPYEPDPTTATPVETLVIKDHRRC